MHIRHWSIYKQPLAIHSTNPSYCSSSLDDHRAWAHVQAAPPRFNKSRHLLCQPLCYISRLEWIHARKPWSYLYMWQHLRCRESWHIKETRSLYSATWILLLGLFFSGPFIAGSYYYVGVIACAAPLFSPLLNMAIHLFQHIGLGLLQYKLSHSSGFWWDLTRNSSTYYLLLATLHTTRNVFFLEEEEV